MIKPTNFMNFHLTILHIYPFVMVKIQTHFYQIIQKNIVPNDQKTRKIYLDVKDEMFQELVPLDR